MRRVAVLAVLAAALLTTSCAAPASPPVPSEPAGAPLVAFYGDSYTLGTGASDPSQRWSTRIAEDRGWREFNPSVNGLGFVAGRDALGVDLPGDIIAADPDIVIVTMGLNDAYALDRGARGIREELAARIADDFERLSTRLPEARIIVVEPFWYTEERPNALDEVIGLVSDAAAAINAEYIPGASEWIQGRDGEMAFDGLHPNDDGYALLTERMDEQLTRLGL